MKKIIEAFETELRAFRTTSGSAPFTHDVWHGLLKEDRRLNQNFQPGDKVRVIVEKINATIAKNKT